MRISDRVQAMQNSPIRKFNPLADAAKAEGVKIYHLNIGQPDIETPSVFWEAVKGFDQKVLAYAGSWGLPELQEIRYESGKKRRSDHKRRFRSTDTGFPVHHQPRR